MSDQRNKYGLSRRIPDDIKAQIRKNSYYGCVVCGAMIYQYEHVNPEFREAREHDPCRMAILCGRCHDQVTRHFWSKEKILKAMQNPRNKKRGFASGEFDIRPNNLEVTLGTCRWVNVTTILAAGKERLLYCDSPEAAGAPLQLSGRFYDSNGSLVLEIVRNEYHGYIADWDIRTTGGKHPEILITSPDNQTILKVRTYPTENRLEIVELNMRYGPYRIKTDEGDLVLHRPDGHSNTVRALKGVDIDCAIMITGNGWVFGTQKGRPTIQSNVPYFRIEGLTFRDGGFSVDG